MARISGEQGKLEEGISEMLESLSSVRATGSALYRPFFLTLLSETYGKGRHVQKGLDTIAAALDTGNNTGERWYEAETCRTEGVLLLQPRRQQPQSNIKDVSDAETCFRRAIEVARHQEAKSLELRATMSLSRLLHQQGKTEEARKMLAEIYGWFTEGFDTNDLKEAKALLDELS